MKPYYKDELCELYHGDSQTVLTALGRCFISGAVTITDPPYNVGYSYSQYKDNLTDKGYAELLRLTLLPPCVVIHYPEDMFKVAEVLCNPSKCVAWTYNANTPRQWRMVSWFWCQPDLSLVKQPYKNQEDKRIRALTEAGSQGTDLYDWWHEEQVKNVSEEKTEHPCQIPESVMNKIVRITPAKLVIDPFCGSGTTLVACKNAGIKSIGIDMDESYLEICVRRLSQQVLPLPIETPSAKIVEGELDLTTR